MSNKVKLNKIRQWRILNTLVIKESAYFTTIIEQLMPDDSYAELQQTLIKQPESGDLIQGSGGLRKVRWRTPGTGKRGGVRVIYYWLNQQNEIYMLYAYKKTKQQDLTNDQIKRLRQVVAEELEDG